MGCGVQIDVNIGVKLKGLGLISTSAKSENYSSLGSLRDCLINAWTAVAVLVITFASIT
jgi:hypothetical protein